ncbi:MAG: GNAT family N-acetyltransferase [Planctomycetota bacterium]
MAAQVVVRDATDADVPVMASLLGELFAQEVEFRPDRTKQEAGLRAVLHAPHAGRLIVAEADDDGVVGVATLLWVPSTALGGLTGVLDDFVVRADQRGRGVGSILLDAALAAARDAGCLRVKLQTDAENLSAQRLYERHGFAASTMRVMVRMMSASE